VLGKEEEERAGERMVLEHEGFAVRTSGMLSPWTDAPSVPMLSPGTEGVEKLHITPQSPCINTPNNE